MSENSDKLRVLFVDDMPERHGAFCRLNAHHAVSSAFRVEQALDLLGRERFDVVSLDHDMSEEDYGDFHRRGGGHVIAEWMVEHVARLGDPWVVIHTWNPVAAPRMHALLTPSFSQVLVRRFHPQRCVIPTSWKRVALGEGEPRPAALVDGGAGRGVGHT